jgi:DNA-directed RNA polymerase subunit K/omega
MNTRVSLVMNMPMGANKYEVAIVAAREARRLNNYLRLHGETETSSAKVTTIALASTLHGEVPFQYVTGRALPAESQPTPPMPSSVDAE